MLYSLGRAAYRFRWAVVIAWILLFSLGTAFAPRVLGVLRGGGYTIGNSESVVAYNKLNKGFGYRALTFTVVFSASRTKAPQMIADAREFEHRVRGRFGHTLTVTPPVLSPDRVVAVERIYSQPQEDFGASYATSLRAMFPRGSVSAHLTGPSAIFHDMESVSDSDLHAVELVTLPLAMIVLLFIFGSVVASLVPILMAPVAVTIALAEIYFVGHRIDMSIFVLNTTSMLGLGVAWHHSHAHKVCSWLYQWCGNTGRC